MGLFLSKYSRFERTLPDVSGKVFAITGTTSGTGFVAAKTVAQHGGEVILLNRPSTRSVASLEKLQTEVPTGKFVAIDCDLMDMSSVRKAAQEIKSKYTKLYCLSNNAGIMATPDEITKDGFDKQMQTNHLSHFLLTRELLPLLKASVKDCGDARVVQHSSIARDGTKDNLLKEEYLSKQLKDGQLGGDDEDAGAVFTGPKWERYCQTKLANSVFCQALHKKLSESKDETTKGIRSLCAHPGVSQTNLGDHLDKGKSLFIKSFLWVWFNLFNQSVEDGSMGLIKCMMEPSAQSGVLYGPSGVGLYGWAVALPTKDHEKDPMAQELLWDKSEEAIGAKFKL